MAYRITYDAEDEALMAALARPKVAARVRAAKAGEKLTWEQANAELGLTEEELAAEIARLEAESPVMEGA
jgi:hypothetical protein